MRYLIFNFDGTGNGSTDEHPTNVRKFFNALSRVDQVPFYFAGPGDETNGGWWDQLIGKGLGIGCGDIRDSALATFDSAYQDGDQIAVTGFSRGGSVARMFCSELAKKGHEVAFLGVWDTVAAFLPFGRAQQETLFGDLHVSPRVLKAFHAVSIDEDRAAFAPNLMNARDGITEVWFKGNHADVGGGYEECGLSDIALEWMIEKAACNGITLDADYVETLKPDPDQDCHREDLPLRRRARRVGVKRDDKWAGDDAVYHGSVG